MQRIQKILSARGYCSRRKAEELIKQGKVFVNGKEALLGDSSDEDANIKVNNKEVKQNKKRYIMFHKPIGCVTAVKDSQYKTVMDYVKIKGIFPIGRLDYNTSGLLLLTNDGDFANSIAHPRYEIQKSYLVEINNPITRKELTLLREGIEIDKRNVSCKVRKISSTLLELSIHEGRNRIVRRMLEQIGYKVTRLQRIKIGKLELVVQPEKYRELTEKEKKLIFEK